MVINCNASTARDKFVTVKEQFDKCDGIQAYHGSLSFKDEPNITPELAQQIGTEFAKRVWGNSFQPCPKDSKNSERKFGYATVSLSAPVLCGRT